MTNVNCTRILYKIIRSSLFRDNLIGLLINPLYLIRSDLYRAVKKSSKLVHGNVLDVGCGEKPYEHLFSDINKYLGIDVEVSGHDHKKSKVDIFYDGKNLPFNDNEFDAVVCFEVLEHAIDYNRLLSEMVRVLKPGGVLLITVPFIWPEHEKPFDFRRFTQFGMHELFSSYDVDSYEVDQIGSDVRTLLQLVIYYFVYKLLPQKRFVRLCAQILIIPINLVTILLEKILPNSHEIYFNLFVRIKK